MDSTIIPVDHRRKNLAHKESFANSRDPPDNPMDKYSTLPIPEDKCLATYVWIDGTGDNLRSKDLTLKFVPVKPKDKFSRLMDRMEERIRKETFLSMTFSQQLKYMPPYYCPRNLANIYKIECRRRESRNTDTFDENLGDLPILTYDGSLCGQSKRKNSDLYLFPRAIYKDPFKRGNSILVMCDTYNRYFEPTPTNHRYRCAAAANKCKEDEPWFGVEQQFYVLNPSDSRPFGWPKGGFPKSSTHYYCAIGGDKILGRDLIEAHYRCCLYAGIPLWGANPEMVPSHWMYKVGPSVGINAGDDAWMARYILNILGEKYGVTITLDPRPVVQWPACGAHTNFSTLLTRRENGISVIQKGIKKLAACHDRHIKVYDPRGGLDNRRRLTGTKQTSIMDKFTAGVADRFCSVRIPRTVAENKCGFLEDRRPSSNADPYQVTDALMRTFILNQ